MENTTSVISTTDYAEILRTYRLEYVPSEYYWQVGEITKSQGWILHLSVITCQVIDLLHAILPQLIVRELAFKIIRDYDTAESILQGSLGYMNLGKMVSIYVEDDRCLASIAKEMITLTLPFKGPLIPTDRRLGGVLFTRYGSFHPIIHNNDEGQPVKHIYDGKGNLFPDPYSIPFKLPQGITWPFREIASPEAPKPNKLLNNAYYPFSVIKSDAKGDVLKALYFQKLWRIRSCLIKQGRQNMFANATGKTIEDRLRWQYDLYKDLTGDIPLPEIFDYFEENGDSYLAMEFINGSSLTKYISSIYDGRCWSDLSSEARFQLLDYLEMILLIIQRLHQKGYVHRDVTPENFLIDKKGRIFLIDMELAWSSRLKRPEPPFHLGTLGFTSPEQFRIETPTVKEDIYALGSLMLVFFTNLPPTKFNQSTPYLLKKQLSFFIQEEKLTDIIGDCFEISPSQRPELETIQSEAKRCKEQMNMKTIRPATNEDDSDKIKHTTKKIISAGLKGLTLQGMLSPKQRWVSRMQRREDRVSNEQMELALYEGWHTGMSGPLWLVATAKCMGFDITPCQNAYFSSWNYIKDHYFKCPSSYPQGLYSGGSGIALAITKGLASGLIPFDVETKELLKLCFLQTTSQPNLSTGLAGQGIALLKCSPWLGKDYVKDLLSKYIEKLVNLQQADGSWINDQSTNKQNIPVNSLDNGVTGIIWFLLSFIERYPGVKEQESTIKALSWLIKTTSAKCDSAMLDYILVYIRAYEVLKDSYYRNLAEKHLLALPPRPVYIDFTLQSGLTRHGELYLEAYKVFENPIWLERAGWIAELLVHCFIEIREGVGYWSVDLGNAFTADLFTGNSGIIHFLLRFLTPRDGNHPLSPHPYQKTNDLVFKNIGAQSGAAENL